VPAAAIITGLRMGVIRYGRFLRGKEGSSARFFAFFMLFDARFGAVRYQVVPIARLRGYLRTL
jgi:hypothetical protein